MKRYIRRLVSILRISAMMLACQPAAALAGELTAYHHQDLVFWMNNVPSSWYEYGVNNDAMYVWNLYVDAFRYREDDDPDWGSNGESEFGGYPSDESLHDQWWLLHWDGALAMTCWWIKYPYLGRCEFSETDVVFNPAYSWTFDRLEAADDNTKVYYPAVLMHELGHVLGFKTETLEDEDYRFNLPTVMHEYTMGAVQDSMPTIHAPDAALLRDHYANQASPKTITNFMVVAHYPDSEGKWMSSSVNRNNFIQGETITVSNITVENPGTTAITNARVRFYLSPDRDISPSDIQLADWHWESFPSEGWGVFDLGGTIPADTPPGSYYVGALASCNGYASDDIPWDDSTFVKSPITVAAAAPAGVAASDGTHPDRVAVSWSPVPAAAFYQVFRAESPAGTKTPLTGWTGATSFNDTTAVPQVTYYYWVKAAASVGGAGASAFSDYDTGWRYQLQPEIAVSQGATPMVDGISTVSFGTLGPGQTGPTFTFTVTNTGAANLSIGPVTLYDGSPGAFAIDTTGMVTTLVPGGSTSFTATFQPPGEGYFYTSLRIANNDADESPFDILLTGRKSGIDPGFNPDANNSAYGLALQGDGKILLGGSFTQVGGVTRNRLARINSDGTLDSGFDPNVNGSVYNVVVQDDGGIVIGGNFTTVADTARNRIARLDTAGTLDPGFNPAPNSGVFCMAVQGDGKIVLGGGFTEVGGTARNYLARLNPDGTLDTGFNPGADGAVYTLAIQADGKILLGGAFTGVAGQPRNRIARVDAGGTLDAGFNPNANDTVISVAVQPDGRILLGGEFWNVGGVNRTYIARLEASGSVDAGFNARLGGSDVKCILVQTNGMILAGGAFTGFNGVDRPHMARLYPDGTLDDTLNANVGGNSVSGIALQPDGGILLGGYFSSAGGTTRNNIARLIGEPSTQSVSAPDATQVRWLRGGTAPEVGQVTFDLSTNSGLTWTTLGSGTRISGGWSRTGASLPAVGLVRARGRAPCGYANGSSIVIEQSTAFGFPDIAVATGETNLANGGSTVTFGTVDVGQAGSPTTFTVTNVGGANLSVGAVTVNGGLPAEFVADTTGMATSLAPGASTTFTVAFHPAGSGTRNATIHIANGDADENPFAFSVQGSGRLVLAATYNSGTEVPLATNGFTATGSEVNFTLNCALTTGSELMVVNNTGLGFIEGTFDNLANGQTVAMSYAGVTYRFMANYFGGSGNDLVLVWAGNRAFAWGLNSNGQIGDNTSGTNRLLPVAVTSTGVLAGKTILALAGGVYHSVALCSDGTVATWGYNNYGQLGDNTTTQRRVPVLVNTASGVSALYGKRVVAITAGSSHCLALCSDGTVAAWGYASSGQIGDGSLFVTYRSVPVAVSFGGSLTGKIVVAIAAGESHSMALFSDGTVAAWGAGSYGQIGDGNTTNRRAPVAVSTASGASALYGKTAIAICAGWTHSMALCSDGTVAAWGYNGGGQLGDNGASGGQSSLPVAVNTTDGISALYGKTAVSIAAAVNHGLAPCSDGSLTSWGYNYYGQVGDNTTTTRLAPVAVNTTAGVSALAGKSVVGIAAGAYHSLAMCSDGTLAAWGSNASGQLGDNTTNQHNVPVAVVSTPLAAGERFTRVASGPSAYHTLAVVAAPIPPAPSIDITGNGTSISNNDTTPAVADGTDFGSALVAYGTVARTFTIHNTGSATLNLSSTPKVMVSGPQATDFTVTLQPASPVGSGGTTSFEVTFAPDATGVRTASLTIENDAANANPYVFAIQGAGEVIPASVTLADLSQTYDGTAKSVAVATTPPGLAMDVTYNGSASPPTDAGSYAVIATVNDPNYQGGVAATLVIRKAEATVSLDNLAQTYDGTPRLVLIVTDPPGLTLDVTYNGSSVPPSAHGEYLVGAIVVDPNYQGSAADMLVISGESIVAWRARQFIPQEIAGGLAADDADPDADHLRNLAEYALGTDPHQFTPPLTATKNGDGLVVVFQRPKGLPDVVYSAESSFNLVDWQPCIMEMIVDGPLQTMRAADPLTSGDPTRRLIRLRFVRP